MLDKWLIAVDLDGTLFGADHQVSPRTVDAIRAVVERGHSIVVVTGRSAYSAMSRIASLPANVRIVCSNGAYETHRTGAGRRWSDPIPVATVRQLRHRILQSVPSASFGWETANGLSYDEQFIIEAGGADTLEQGGGQSGVQNGENEEFGMSDAFKLYVRSPQFVRGDLQRKLIPVVEGQAEVSTSGAPFVELTASGVDKASGLARVAADSGFTAHRTIAFGDNLNDIPMLRWAFESVAMGNALNEVKDIANTHTLRNVDDGVATLLEAKLKSGVL